MPLSSPVSSLALLRMLSGLVRREICAAFCCGALALAIGPAVGVRQAEATQTPAAPGTAATAPAVESGQKSAATPIPETSPAAAPSPDAAQPQAQTPPATPDTPQSSPAPPAASAPLEVPSAPAPQAAPTPQVAPAAAEKAAAAKPAAPDETSQRGAITEDELKRQLVGKPLYLRGGYLENTLNFNEHGGLIGHSPQGSYTLNGVEIDRVHLTKHKVELEGVRYGLHFLGALAYEDPTAAVDRVRITPKKKVVKITIDREIVVTPKKKKEKDQGRGPEKGKDKNKAAKPGAPLPLPPAQAAQQAQAQPPVQPVQPESAAAPAAAVASEMSEADQLKASIAAAPEAERPADPASVTTTISPAHAAKVLEEALDRIFAPGLDERMMASLPDFWKLYYQAVAAKSDYRPKDPSVLRQNVVDQKAKLLSTFEPPSNEFAQANGVAGMALYHTVIGPDGKPGEIAVGRPIGFGLDENAVDSIRKASFQPATKEGKPVPVLLDLVVQFRIYSKRTAVAGTPDAADKKTGPVLPGPYTLQHMP
jgi:outer membrane biosynthesis protein TonB